MKSTKLEASPHNSTKKLELKFLGGVEGDIGGNIVLFTIDGKGYFFDFGLELTKSRIVEKLGYSKEQIYKLELAPSLDPIRRTLKVKNVFISHNHVDHWAGLTALPDDVRREFTIYLPLYTYYMLEGNLKGFATPHPMRMKIDLQKPSKTVFNDGQLEVIAFPVDHSVAGSCCFIIKDVATGNVFLYTGDFRTHGALSQVLKSQFWDYLKRRNRIKAVICEGTQFGQACEPYDEIEVARKIVKTIASYRNKIAFAVTSPNDFYRLKILVKCGKRTHREVLISNDRIGPKLKTLESFMKTKDAFATLLDEVSFKELSEVLLIPSSGHNRIELLRKIKSKPGNYLLVCTAIKSLFRILSELTDVSSGGCCILSLSEFFEEELGVKTEEVVSALSKTGLVVFRAHSSGHAFPEEIARILKILKPKTVFVLHTKDPESFKGFLKGKGVKSQIICPRKDQSFKF